MDVKSGYAIGDVVVQAVDPYTTVCCRIVDAVYEGRVSAYFRSDPGRSFAVQELRPATVSEVKEEIAATTGFLHWTRVEQNRANLERWLNGLRTALHKMEVTGQ